MLRRDVMHYEPVENKVSAATSSGRRSIYLARTPVVNASLCCVNERIKGEGSAAIPSEGPTHDPAHGTRVERRIWDLVSRSPLHSLWNLEGIPVRVVAKHTWNAFFDDNLVGRAAELGFYFLFALFPSLVTATALLGLAARSASHIYYSLLGYLSIVLPHDAMGMVLETFNQTTAAATSGKLTFGLVAAIWSASVGFSAIQDSLNVVYRVKETRSYFAARFSAIGVTILLMGLVTLMLASLLGADFFARLAHLRIYDHFVAALAAVTVRGLGWVLAAVLLSIFFAVIYYFAPDVKRSQWHWLTPGAAIGIVGWALASIGLRLYVHLFNNYSVTYGSLGAVIILLTWFYLTGLMLLLGAEINSEIEAAAAAKRLLVLEQNDLAAATASAMQVPDSSAPKPAA
ncbi:YihY/virulence factor BrkB family protein [Tunturibacter empetritectus]|uniref:Membrane protein n=1 Tax=Tunturiibacter empetritectus TaxID=3069691 RepID=A0A7W8IH36_9BACT|nr:YihY/virulence factor BrkB family protein [Edaphobacter lichenicola]MBB5317015.1 membrane protein [Edaphobacter lichenicola]